MRRAGVVGECCEPEKLRRWLQKHGAGGCVNDVSSPVSSCCTVSIALRTISSSKRRCLAIGHVVVMDHVLMVVSVGGGSD